MCLYKTWRFNGRSNENVPNQKRLQKVYISDVYLEKNRQDGHRAHVHVSHMLKLCGLSSAVLTSFRLALDLLSSNCSINCLFTTFSFCITFLSLLLYSQAHYQIECLFVGSLLGFTSKNIHTMPLIRYIFDIGKLSSSTRYIQNRTRKFNMKMHIWLCTHGIRLACA